MFWSTNRNKLLSNHCANLKSREAKLVEILDDSRGFADNNKKNQTWKEVVNPFITRWDKPFAEKRNGNLRSVSMDYIAIKQHNLRSFYLLSTRNHCTLKYLMAGQSVARKSWFSEVCEETSLIIFLLIGINRYEELFFAEDFSRGKAVWRLLFIPSPMYFISNLNVASCKSLEIQVYSKTKFK